MKEKAWERMKTEREAFNGILELLEQMPDEESLLSAFVTREVVENYDRIMGCMDNGRPFIGGYYCAAPEIYSTMDLPWYMMMQTPFMLGSTGLPYLLDDIDQGKAMLGNDLCTAISMSIHLLEAGLTPLPTALVGILYPCDALPMFHQVLSHNKAWSNVPVFTVDPPYYADDRSIDYFAAGLKKMIPFLEEHTGHKFDLDRLREIIEESNKQYELWLDYNELRRAVPCPHGWSLGGQQCFSVSQYYCVGDSRGTDWFQRLVANAELKVREKAGGVPGEKVRVFWIDLLPFGWFLDFLPWMEEAWSACLVMDMLCHTPYTLIDTSSEESMFRGMAKRNLADTLMVRQVQGTTQNFVSDIQRVVNDFKIDCVIYSGHMGHKDQAASIGIMREVCRDLGVSFLDIGLDLYDRRYTSIEIVKDKISRHFAAMGLQENVT